MFNTRIIDSGGFVPFRTGARAVFFFAFFIFAFSSFSQDDRSVKRKKEMLQGTWGNWNSNYTLKFLGDTVYVTLVDSIICKSIYTIKGRRIDTHCPAKEPLVYKFKHLTNSTMSIRPDNGYFDNYYRTYVKHK